eukprot:TRINITY_DN4053_c0_g1_i2.p1 TRINITY_DN4053_c0_g1~~TRINITY_DN4053_c0_g1_i2.p1  ORF type:complete len:198 (-),score=31.58 TRINITY_DN4053_c0_g1_i2:84-677(-)
MNDYQPGRSNSFSSVTPPPSLLKPSTSIPSLPVQHSHLKSQSSSNSYLSTAHTPYAPVVEPTLPFKQSPPKTYSPPSNSLQFSTPSRSRSGTTEENITYEDIDSLLEEMIVDVRKNSEESEGKLDTKSSLEVTEASLSALDVDLSNLSREFGIDLDEPVIKESSSTKVKSEDFRDWDYNGDIQGEDNLENILKDLDY